MQRRKSIVAALFAPVMAAITIAALLVAGIRWPGLDLTHAAQVMLSLVLITVVGVVLVIAARVEHGPPA